MFAGGVPVERASAPPSPRQSPGHERSLTNPLASLRVLLLGYVVLVPVLLLLGYLLTHVLDNSVGRWDAHVNQWFVRQRTGAWNTITGAFTFGLNTVPVIAVAVVVVVLLVLRHHVREGLVLVFALSLEITVFLSVTFIVARPRPQVARLNATPSTSSFPSGHTAAALVLYVGIAVIVHKCTSNRLARVLADIVAVIAVVGVALSRVYRGMHHPTDVIAGAAYGAACIWFALVAVRAGSPDPTAEDDRGRSPHERHLDFRDPQVIA
ncbi:MAG: phosphoesterase PA-phosphatase related [Actinomycetia bacterium]|nr:phosphoesterase PA-phosphatase related [Actinomycetes bacterium]